MRLLIDVESDQPRQWAIPYTCVFCINALIGGFFARSVLVAPTPDTQPGAATSSGQVVPTIQRRLPIRFVQS